MASACSSAPGGPKAVGYGMGREDFCGLPFGLRSAPKIFNALADAVEWMVGSTDVWHYLDDFIVCGAEGCASSTCVVTWGFPEGPTTRITFLGFEIDTQVRLPMAKVVQLRELLEEWKHKKRCTKRE